MIDGLIQLWEDELDRAYAVVVYFRDAYYEGGTYLEGDCDRYWELPEVEEADARLALAEETLERLLKFAS